MRQDTAVMRTVFNGKPVALVVMDAFGKYTHFADASRLRTGLKPGKCSRCRLQRWRIKAESGTDGDGAERLGKSKTVTHVTVLCFLPPCGRGPG